jgi:hypothetical protein
MASPTPLRLPIVPFLVLLCFSPACTAGRVKVSVYYETLCPFCSGFVVNELARIFHDGVSSIADLRLVPFGNGRVSVDGSITCQVSAYSRTHLSWRIASMYVLFLELCALFNNLQQRLTV